MSLTASKSLACPKSQMQTYSCVTAYRKPQNYVHLRFSCKNVQQQISLANNVAKERLLTIGSLNIIPIIFVTKTDLFRVLRLSVYCVSVYAKPLGISTLNRLNIHPNPRSKSRLFFGSPDFWVTYTLVHSFEDNDLRSRSSWISCTHPSQPRLGNPRVYHTL